MIREAVYLDFTNSLIDGNKSRCFEIVDALLDEKIETREIYVNLIQRALYSIGNLWEQNKLTIAEEHIGTRISEDIVAYFSALIREKGEGVKKVVIACIDKEFHQLGAKMAADIFSLNGWDVSFSGASTPTREILKMIEEKKPDILGLSYGFYLNFLKLTHVLGDIKKYFPSLKIIVGGNGAIRDRDEIMAAFPDILFFIDIIELDEYLKTLK
jgi:MerR family transcriptional regulator, light-induced transcriptional regulator